MSERLFVGLLIIGSSCQLLADDANLEEWTLPAAAYYWQWEEDRVLLSISSPSHLIIELKTDSEGKCIDLYDFHSPYLEPSATFKDILGTSSPEILVETGSGGTGVYRRSVTLLTVQEGRLKQIGDFLLEQTQDADVIDWSEVTKGSVSFPEHNTVLHEWTTTITNKVDGSETTTAASDRYRYNGVELVK
jgi:hypothetical protein